MTVRPTLPDWPAMMPVELAHQYLGVGRDLFLGLTARNQVRPVDVGARRSLWRRRDLDALIERLPVVDSKPADEASSAESPLVPIAPEEAALQRVQARRRRR